MYRLLIVEDEEFLRKSLCAMVDWESAGIQIAGAVENGREALRFLSENGQTDFVFTDIRMPVMDGLELAGELQNRYPNIKTVLYSAYSEFAFAQKGIEYGVSGYLLKSQDEEEIAAYFRELCRRMEEETQSPSSAEKGFWETREALSNRLLNGISLEDEQKAILEGGDCKLDLKNGPLAAALFELDETPMLREELGGLGLRQLHKFLAEQVLSRMEMQGMGHLLQFGEPVIALWKDFSTDWPDRLRALHKALCEDLKSFEAGAPVTLTIAIGPPVQRISDLPSSWSGAKERLEKRFFLGPGLVLDSNSRIPDVKPESNTVLPVLQEAETLCRCQDLPGLLAFLEQLKVKWKTGAFVDRNTANWFGVQLLQQLSSMHNSPPHARDESALAARSGDLARLITRSETLDSLFDQLAAACKELLDDSPAASLQQKKLIEKAIRFLQENYISDISLERTASYVAVHPVYLSRLFRQETGQTFKNMLTQLRISKAKELLRDPNRRVYEISEMVGYKKPRYFSELFKEITGMTPLEYLEKS